MIRFSKVHILLICFVLLLSYAASAENCVLVTDDRRMCYDCVFFDDAWPGDIRDDMERLFPALQVLHGVKVLWHPLAGNDLPHVFAVLSRDDALLLAGAQKPQGLWEGGIISDHFFKPGDDPAISMVPWQTMSGNVDSYNPTVVFGEEAFVFQGPIRASASTVTNARPMPVKTKLRTPGSRSGSGKNGTERPIWSFVQGQVRIRLWFIAERLWFPWISVPSLFRQILKPCRPCVSPTDKCKPD